MGYIINSLLLTLVAYQSMSQDLGIYNGFNGDQVSVEQAVQHVKPGAIVIIGEKHGHPWAQKQQLQILQALKARGLKVSVGMEFVSYPDQEKLNNYRSQLVTEADFLKSINWGSPSFEFYKDQILFPKIADGETTIALNSPRFLSGKIAKTGLASLTDEDKLLLPPQFELGRESYKKRFASVMPHIPNPQLLDNYFAAQSLWDDTMAWKASQFIKSNPDQVMVIIVGEFHVQYGGGLPYRLAQRGVQDILTVSQLDHEDYSEEELIQAIIPSHEYGPRANFIWVF